jgi:hypothetical protein
MIRTRLDGQAKIGGQERRAQFGHKLLACVAFATPFLAAKAAIKAALVPSPVAGLMASSSVVSMGGNWMRSAEGM